MAEFCFINLKIANHQQSCRPLPRPIYVFAELDAFESFQTPPSSPSFIVGIFATWPLQVFSWDNCQTIIQIFVVPCSSSCLVKVSLQSYNLALSSSSCRVRDWAAMPHLLGGRPTCMHVWQTLPGCGNVWQALPTSVWQCMASCQHACMATHSYASSPICCRLFSQKESARGRLINLFLICKDLGARLARIYVLHIGLYALTPIQSNDISCLTNSRAIFHSHL